MTTHQSREIIAAAIANARGNRRGVPTITNILDVLPAKLREEVLDDADAIIESLDKNGALKNIDAIAERIYLFVHPSQKYTPDKSAYDASYRTLAEEIALISRPAGGAVGEKAHLEWAERHDIETMRSEKELKDMFEDAYSLGQADLLTAAPSPSGGGWMPIETAPKSLAEGSRVRGVYLLGFCPEDGADPTGCIDVIWWEPLTKSENGKMGCWYSGGALESRPTHWQPLPQPPQVQP